MTEMETAQRCFLLELPAELRLRIYDYVYNERCLVQLIVDSKRVYHTLCNPLAPFGSGSTRFTKHAALLKTCRLICKEAAPVLYSTLYANISAYLGSERHQGTDQRDAGALESCTFLPHITEIGKLTIYTRDGAVDASAVAARLRQLISALAGLGPEPMVDCIELTTVSEAWFSGESPDKTALDPIVRALIDWNVRPAVRIGYMEKVGADLCVAPASNEIMWEFSEKYQSAYGLCFR